jgi:hypothetical protein
MVEAARKAPALEERMKLTREQMQQLQAQVDQEAQQRAARRAQDARKEETVAKEEANQRRAAPVAATRPTVDPEISSSSSSMAGSGEARCSTEASGGQAPSEAQPPQRPDTSIASGGGGDGGGGPPSEPARGASVEQDGAGPAKKLKQAPVVSANLGAVNKMFGWKGKSVKATKTAAEDSGSGEPPAPAHSTAPARAPPAAAQAAPAVSKEPTPAAGGNHRGGEAHGSAPGGREEVGAASCKDVVGPVPSTRVEVKVSPDSEDSFVSAVDFVEVCFVCLYVFEVATPFLPPFCAAVHSARMPRVVDASEACRELCSWFVGAAPPGGSPAARAAR